MLVDQWTGNSGSLNKARLHRASHMHTKNISVIPMTNLSPAGTATPTAIHTPPVFPDQIYLNVCYL
ncbi:TPA: hypothetical protein ACNMOY_005422, partial [Klebsiella pneumoniae]